MAQAYLQIHREGVILEVVVVPRASRTKLVGLHDGRLKIQLAAPPVDGAGNQALRTALADWLDLPKRSVEIIRGESGRKKSVLLRGVDEAYVVSRLGLPG